jgi:ankyrin repeat protein
MTALTYAISASIDIKSMRELLGLKEVNINLRDGLGNTPLIVAAEMGNTDVIRALLLDSCLQPNITNNWEQTALLVAIQNGQASIVDLLLEHTEWDACAVDDNGESAPHYAVRYPQASIVSRLLAKAGCDLKAQNNAKRTAVELAFQGNRLQIARVLLKEHLSRSEPPASIVMHTNMRMLWGKYSSTSLDQPWGSSDLLSQMVFDFDIILA